MVIVFIPVVIGFTTSAGHKGFTIRHEPIAHIAVQSGDRDLTTVSILLYPDMVTAKPPLCEWLVNDVQQLTSMASLSCRASQQSGEFLCHSKLTMGYTR